jgi:hypothetical protein
VIIEAPTAPISWHGSTRSVGGNTGSTQLGSEYIVYQEARLGLHGQLNGIALLQSLFQLLPDLRVPDLSTPPAPPSYPRLRPNPNRSCDRDEGWKNQLLNSIGFLLPDIANQLLIVLLRAARGVGSRMQLVQ